MLKRVSDPQVSPDGRQVVFVLRETDMEANRGRTHLWLLDLDAKDATPRQITRDPAGESNPRWAPDGRSLYLPVGALRLVAGLAHRARRRRGAAGDGLSARRGDDEGRAGRQTASPSRCRCSRTAPDLKCTADRLEAAQERKATGVRYDQLFIRHWDDWEDGTLSTLFTAVVGADGKAGAAVNVSGKVRGHVPSRPFGGDEEYTFSPDGKRLVFSARLADRTEPWSTNFDLYEAPADGSIDHP